MCMMFMAGQKTKHTLILISINPPKQNKKGINKRT